MDNCEMRSVKFKYFVLLHPALVLTLFPRDPEYHYGLQLRVRTQGMQVKNAMVINLVKCMN
jgi:hypothetical protein